MSVETSKDNSRLCGICEENVSKYCCPRCSVLYCSLDCYKFESHSECSESFYKDCIHDEMSSHHVDEESKQKMIDILKRMHEESAEGLDNIPEDEEIDSDDDEIVDLKERMEGVDLDDADAVWSALTDDEKKEFQAMVDHGDVGSIISLWLPWWTYRKQDKLVEEVSETSEEEEALKKCPHMKIVPKLNSLTKVQPSPVVKFNITNVLASYAFIMRYINGEVDPVECIVYLLDICANLASQANFDDSVTAVESVLQKCLQSELIETDLASLEIVKFDTFSILHGPSEQNKKYYCNAGLSHLIEIITTAKHSCESQNENRKSKYTSTFSKKFPDHGNNDWNKLDVSQLKKIVKKIEYYLSYLQHCNVDFDYEYDEK